MSIKDKRVLIAGGDGYLGWALTVYLRSKGIECFGIDNFSRRSHVNTIGSDSLVPIGPQARVTGTDVLHRVNLESAFRHADPDVIVHFAEQPSAPFSMKSSVHAVSTQHNNLAGTMNILWTMRDVCPEAHLIKLGTMGEYSDWIYDKTPIPEHHTMSVMRMDPHITENHFMEIPTPRAAGSFYHWSKIFDSNNIEFACKIWGLRATDINQGVVYGSRIEAMDENNRTRFDYDSYFGTVVNRFIVQSIIDTPLTVYGKGGQTRGYLNINDVMRAIELVMENPPNPGQFEIVNQLTEVFSVTEIATMVSEVTGCDVMSLENPRIEREEHFYDPEYKKLKEWGLKDPRLMKDVLPDMVEDLKQFKDKVRLDVIGPDSFWRKEKEGVTLGT